MDKIEKKEEKLWLRKKFYDACRDGDLLEFNRLIDLVDPKTEFDKALSLAARWGQLDIVNRLIPMTDPKRNQSDAFRKAVEYDHKECAYALLPHSDPHAVGNQALRSAVYHAWLNSTDPVFEESGITQAHYALVLTLLNDSRVNGSMVEQAIHRVVRHDRKAIATKALVQNVSLDKYPDALILAAENGCPESVAVILEHVDPSQVSTSLLSAAIEGVDVETLRLVFPYCEPCEHTDALRAAIENIKCPFANLFGDMDAVANELRQLIADYERKEMLKQLQAAHGIEQPSKKRKM